MRPATTRSESESGQAWRDLSLEPTETENTHQNEDTELAGRDPLRDRPEWLQEFTDNLVEEKSSSAQGRTHELFSCIIFRAARKSGVGQAQYYVHFPKDRNCYICLRTQIIRAPCRIRIGTVVPRADNYGVLITADHKVLSEGCESRNSHRCAVVGQDLATQWIQPIIPV